MKKIILSFVALMVLAPLAQAATLNSVYYNKLYFNERRVIQPIDITAEADGEIAAEHGITIILDPERWILWDAVDSVTVQGPAVTAGFMEASPKPIYSADYKRVTIPVKADWAKGSTATMSGLAVRAYNRTIGQNYFFGYDLTGDGVADVHDINAYWITDESIRTDNTAPYPPYEFKGLVASDGTSVTLSWRNSPDYDVAGTTVLKKVTRAGVVMDETTLTGNTMATEYIDRNVQLGDKIVYTVYASDQFRQSTRVAITVEVKVASEAPTEPTLPTEPVVTPVEPPAPTDAQAAELEQLGRLYGYYKVRQYIKCLNTTSEADSACLWAEIDLVYANMLLGKPAIDITLSARDLYLIGRRIVWPERRYQTECVEASVPAKSCPALGKAIKRAHYFIDQK